MYEQIILKNRHLPFINPFNLGYQECDPGHTPGAIYRDCWLLHYVVHGKGVFIENGVRHEIGEDECFVIRPSEITTYIADTADPWFYVWLGFECTLDMPKIFTEARVIDGNRVKRVFLSLLELGLPETDREEFLAGKVFEILQLLSADGIPEENKTHAGNAAFLARDIIESSTGGLTVEKLAAELHLNRSYFGVIFKREFGVTPQKFILSYRLRRAATCMKEMNMMPGQAAAAVGFSDVYSFSRAFHRFFGMSPTAFRRKARTSISFPVSRPEGFIPDEELEVAKVKSRTVEES